MVPYRHFLCVSCRYRSLFKIKGCCACVNAACRTQTHVNPPLMLKEFAGVFYFGNSTKQFIVLLYSFLIRCNSCRKWKEVLGYHGFIIWNEKLHGNCSHTAGSRINKHFNTPIFVAPLSLIDWCAWSKCLHKGLQLSSVYELIFLAVLYISLWCLLCKWRINHYDHQQLLDYSTSLPDRSFKQEYSIKRSL